MKPQTKVLLGDSFKILKQIPDNTFNHVITDPPYNISRPNNFSTIGREGFNWTWDNDFDTCGWIPDVCRVLKPGGSIIIFNDWKLLGEIAACLEYNKMVIKDPIVLEKTNPQPRNVKRRYVSDKEFAIWATKGKGWVFNKREGIGYERSRIVCTVPRKRLHPTKKPPEAIRHILETHTNPGDWVLDPFAGEGTIAIECQNLNRLSFSIEKDETYFEFIQAQLSS